MPWSRSAWGREIYHQGGMVSMYPGHKECCRVGRQGRGDVLGSQFFDAESGQPLTHIDRLLERFPFHDPGDKTTSEGVTIRVIISQSPPS